MSREENNATPNQPENKANKQETLEERLQRIEAEAAKKRKETAPAKEETKPAPKPEEKADQSDKEPIQEKAKPTRKKPAPKKEETQKTDTPVKEDVKAKTEKPVEKAEKPKPRRKPAAKKTTEAKENTPKESEVKAAEKSEAPAPEKEPVRRNTRRSNSKTTEKKETADKPVKAAEKSEEKKPAPAKTTTRRGSRGNSTAAKKDTPAKQSTEEQKKTTSRSASTSKTSTKRTTSSRASAKQSASSKSTSSKTTASSSRSNTSAAVKKTSSNKSTSSKPSAKKATAKKTTPAKKPAKRTQAANTPESDKELIINSSPTQVEIALMENGKLVELHHQKTNNNFTVGDIFLGRIKRLMPGLNAAFVDIGHKKDAFLHYTDLGPKLRSLLKFTAGSINGKGSTHKLDNFKLEPEIIKTGKIDQVLNKRDSILVQVLKEPIGTKGPRLSCEITIPGRFLVLTPFVDVIAVSKKIGNSEERKRLKMLIESIKPKNFGVIVRTAAEGKNVKDLHEELKLMMDKWENIFSQLKGSQPPMKLLSELDKASSILRDILNDSFNNIVVNDKELHGNIKNYMGSFAPDKVGIVNLHKSRKPIFDTHGVTKQIKSSFGKTATMNSGAYLVIEHTEAMHVIDVNSGHKMSSADQEAAVLAVNLESAEEIARQLRLRDIGGIIIVDFIDMRNKEHKQELVTAMRRFMKKDRAQHTILPLSKFGLMQITRQRVRPEVKINTAEVCPSCKGSGKINPSILLTDDLERDLKFILQSRPKSKLVLEVHPYIYAYLKKGLPSIQMKWYMKFYKWIRIRSNADFSMTAYKFYDGNDDEIRLK